ncbi:hypothetical protein SAMN05428989_1534 [Pseudoxanthomonas sp. GM95]|nr:hypothetical protein SAMN05428989_1534 [Pseudoxanthomonas sp. GM95]
MLSSVYRPVQSIPTEISGLTGPCGPASVWLVLTRYGIDASPKEVIERCRYTDTIGCYAVCMAEALQHFGLKVRLLTDPDLSPAALEVRSYPSVDTCSALSSSRLLGLLDSSSSVIVSYLDRGEGHFSPLAGARANKLLLPYSPNGEMLKSEFDKRRRSAGILRQAVIARP